MRASSATSPDVAFVIPARNEASCIAVALESIAAQTHRRERIEVVVSVNGSTDNTAEVARQALRRWPSLRNIVLAEAAAGLAAAKNRAANRALAQILIFLDADSRAGANLADRVLQWVSRGYPAGSIKIVADSPDWLDRGFFGLIDWGKGLFGIHANMLYCERELFIRAGGFAEDIRLAEDLEFLTRLKRQGIRVCHVGDSFIATSTRRLHELPFRLGMIKTFGRWALAQIGVGRRWRY